MNRAKTYLVAAMLFFILINAGTALAVGLPGILEGTGTNFEITDSSYLNITVNSSEEIKVLLQSVPEIVTIHVEPVSGAASTTITIDGFAPNATYYKYEDDYHNLTQFTTDGTGSYSYEQDLSQNHLVFFQTQTSTLFIIDDATGGDCTSVGTWDLGSKTCTLTTDVYETIQIDSDGITLDGAGYTISVSAGPNGVYSNGTSGIAIKNINVENFSAGINLYYCNNNTITGNTLSSSYYGVLLYNSKNNTIEGNTSNLNGFAGILLFLSSENNQIRENTSLDNSYGIVFYPGSNYNTITNNNFLGNIYSQAYNNGTGNVFNLAAPVGGNYWDDHDNTDSDGDGFADNVYYVGGSGVDNLPLAEPFSPQPQDETPPVITIVTPQAYGLYTVGTALDFYAEDEGSGVASVIGDLTNTAGQVQTTDAGFEPVPGVYTLVVSAEDNAGNIAVSDPVYFVVYDPEGGFATGGGWFHPDAESSLPEDGKANFGFVAKYKKGESTGNLEFQYQDAGINLKSTSIDWLVISGANAQFQGTGTINGEGLYTFRVRATDGDPLGINVDYFDIKVWAGTDTEADPVHSAKNVLSGGNIVVHKK